MTISFLIFLFFLFSFILNCFSSCPYEDSALVRWNFEDGADVVIPSGQKVVLSQAKANPKTITIFGQLIFDDVDLNLKTYWIRVENGGALILGTEDCQLKSEISITFLGSSSSSLNIGTDPSSGASLGKKGLAVLNGGTLDLHGRIQGPSWTVLKKTAKKDSKKIILADGVKWKSGSELVVASTDFSFFEANYGASQTEHLKIKKVKGSKKIILSDPLQYTHWGANPERAEVGLLTRNIKIQGDDLSEEEGFGGHIIIRAAAAARIEGVEFSRLGQFKVTARYPVHFHMAKDLTGRPIYVRHNSFHHNFQRCLTIHDTNGVVVEENVGYHTNGHCYFLEDGSEELNVLNHNLGLLTFPILDSDHFLASDTRPAVFWVTNPNNTITNNNGAEGYFGFWYALPMHPTGLAEGHYKDDPRLWPRMLPLLEFSGNTAHSCEVNGLHIDDAPISGTTGKTELAHYTPRIGPYGPPSWELTPVDANFRKFVGYKNRGYGAWARGDSINFDQFTLLDNTRGVNQPGGPNIIQNSQIVGETTNVGNPVSPNWLPNYVGADGKVRTRPVWWTNEIWLVGWEGYDASGPQYVVSCSFENFQATSQRKAGAYGVLTNGPNQLFPGTRFFKNSFKNSNILWQEDYPNQVVSSKERDGPNAVNYLDLDGSSTGTYGTWLVSKNPFLTHSNCQFISDWNGYKCPHSQNGFGYAQINIKNENVGATQFDGNQFNYLKGTFYRLGDSIGSSFGQDLFTVGDYNPIYRTNAFIRKGYTLRFSGNHPTPPFLSVTLYDLAFGEWIVIALPYPSGTKFTIQNRDTKNLEPTDRLTNLDSRHYFFDQTTEHLYVWIENTVRLEAQQFGFTTHNSWYAYLSISASCPGSSCRLTNSQHLNVPGLLPKFEDQYQATLQPCQVSTDVSSTAQATAYFSYDPRTAKLSYYILHDLHDEVKAIRLYEGRVGQEGSQIGLLPFTSSPNRESVILNRDHHAKLYEGNVFVQIETKAYKSGELRGQIGCVGDCSKPQSLPLVDACKPSGDSIWIYQQAPASDWPLWTWEENKADGKFQPSSSKFVLCGSQVLRVELSASGGGFLFGRYAPIQVDLRKFKYLEFWIRGEDQEKVLPLSFDPRVARNSKNDVDPTPNQAVVVSKNMITNHVIDGFLWTRVRIALYQLLGFATVEEAIQKAGPSGNGIEEWTYLLVSYYVWPQLTEPTVFFMDQVRLVSETNEPLSSQTYSQASFNPKIC